MRPFLFFFLAYNFAIINCISQTTVRINPKKAGPSSPEIYKAGLFCQPRNTKGDVLFANLKHTKYNCLRTFEIEWLLKSSPNMPSLLNSIKTLKNWHLDKHQKSDKLVILLSMMPQWLSSSSDTSFAVENVRVYQTRPPANYLLWDSLIRGIVTEVKSWGISPYYEIWNEPDLNYWTGTTQELLELYKHTALAIKQVDPNAKVGGFGLNGWTNGINTHPTPNFGFIPDSIANNISLLGDLIDSAASWAIPLDFISWHLFSPFSNEIKNASNYFKNKISSYSLPPVSMIITEWNSTHNDREQPLHSPQMLKTYRCMMQAGISAHAVAAFQDFNQDTAEFFKEYGMISRGGLLKPAFKSVLLLDYLQNNADTIPVEVNEPIISFSSLKNDTLNILLSNHVYYPFWAAYEELVYNNAFNVLDLTAAGYTTSAQLDSTFRGILPPSGPAPLVTAFNKAKAAYTFADTMRYKQRNIKVVIPGQTGTLQGILIVVDSSNNNIIHKYDSLRSAGYTRAQAVDSLYTKQGFAFINIQTSDSIFSFSMQPNATAFIEFYNVTTTAGIENVFANSEGNIYPNPFNDFLVIEAEAGKQHMQLIIVDALGKEVALINGINQKTNIDVSYLVSGVYFYELRENNVVITRGKLIKN